VRASLELIYAEPGIGSVVIGTLNPAHLRANVAAVEAVLSQPAVSDPVGIAAG
jgi:aryl-alcohol dehydrogenase-like predicted oxidoreductase